MASIMCSKCNSNIHYHSIPNGIEYIVFARNKWDIICNSRFDKNKKHYGVDGLYPKLYRTDTIEEDFEGDFTKIWKCPHCGSILLFNKYEEVTAVYEKSENITISSIPNNEGIAFTDTDWHKITELRIPDNELKGKKPSFVRYSEEIILLSESEQFSKIIVYTRIS